MPALAFTLLVLFLWWVQGIGFVQWLAPGLRQQTVVGWVVGTWLGLLLSLVILVNLYMLLPVTLGQIAWPVTIVLALASLALYLKTQRPKLDIDAHSIVVVVLALFATLLVLRPLLSESDLGFYFSNNGEFSNYAAISDVVQFHDTSTQHVAFGLHSREAVLGVASSVFSALSGKAALWIIQPVAAAFAALAFASLGLLFRHIAYACGLRARQAMVLAPVYAWAILSASVQCFWTLSFASQYLAVALFLGGLLLLVEGDLARRSRIVVVGILIAGLWVAYPEMLVPSVGLLAAFEIVRTSGLRDRAITLGGFAISLVIAVILTNQLGIELMSRGGSIGGSGWNIYGPHRPALGFFAAVTGFTNPFGGPTTTSSILPLVAAVVFGASLVFAIVRVHRAPTPSVRGLMHLGWLFALAVALLFWIIARRGTGNNYPALKFILGFGWIAFLMLGIAIAHVVRWRPVLAPIAAIAALVLWTGLATPAVNFSKNLKRATKQAMFLEDEATRCRRPIEQHSFIAASWFNYAIIGYFIAYERDLFGRTGRWPDGSGQAFVSEQPVVLVGKDFRLSDAAQVTGPYLPRCSGRHFSVLLPP